MDAKEHLIIYIHILTIIIGEYWTGGMRGILHLTICMCIMETSLHVTRTIPKPELCWTYNSLDIPFSELCRLTVYWRLYFWLLFCLHFQRYFVEMNKSSISTSSGLHLLSRSGVGPNTLCGFTGTALLKGNRSHHAIPPVQCIMDVFSPGELRTQPPPGTCPWWRDAVGPWHVCLTFFTPIDIIIRLVELCLCQ